MGWGGYDYLTPLTERQHMKKVAIVGSQELTRENAPYNDPDYEIWSFADWVCHYWLKRCDRLLEIHLANVYMNHPRTPEYWQSLQELDIPVYMHRVADPRVPGAILYPLDAVLELVAKGKNQGKKLKPLNSTVAYALGLAILMEYDVIDIYGVELAHPSERFTRQSDLFSFWNGVALGRGIELNVNCSDGLFVQPLYGSEDTTQLSKIYAMLEKIQQQANDAKRIQHMAEGAAQALRGLMEIE